MRRSGLTLITFIVVTLASVVGVLAAGWRPLLGLDLQGGVAVVLKPTTAADEATIDQAIGIIRSRVDAIGVAEPDISRQGSNIVVQLPGVKDQARALELVGTTAELRFRPVLQEFLSPEALKAAAASTTTTKPGSSTTAATSSTTAGSSTTSSSGATTTTATTAATTSSSQQSMGIEGGAAKGEYALGLQSTATTAATTTAAPTVVGPTTSAAATDTTAVASTDTTALTTSTTEFDLDAALAEIPDITSRESDVADQQVVLPSFDPDNRDREVSRLLLGPALVTGDALSSDPNDIFATVRADTGEWYVQIKFKDGDTNVGAWRNAAALCLGGSAECPSGRLGIVLDGVVLSAPTVQSDFQGTNEATISGNFSQSEAQRLAQVLKYGALPVEFERQQSQEVSATIGRDALQAGVAAGLIGLAIVAVYILAYYRLFGLVALLSLGFSFGLLWSMISWLGSTQGLALSLSGVTGIIVSIGVSIDSNIVYFEQIKDDVQTGRNLRSSTERAFRGAMSTIIKADSVSLIGAGLLYWLTVGPVRGFALYLGLSALLDLIASYFFMRPAVALLSRTSLAARNPKLFGMPAATKPVAQVAA